MSHWSRDDFTKFATYEEAWEDYLERYADDCLSDYLKNYISYDGLLRWAMKQDAFWNDARMMEAFNNANQCCFEDFYTEHEEEDEE